MRAGMMLPGILIVAMLNACTASAASGISPQQAAQHIGETATVCGTIASSHYAVDSDGQPTFINLGKPYPAPIFTIVIFGDYRGKFSTPPDSWTGRLCATGRISEYHGEPEMKVIDPSQVSH
ncbi:MAG TPA: hypothetical protein VFW60_05880 [Rhodanobacteraceae bacterium]|nr:hypothetical protein [Rhodanobacteraceae bacterium]